jgi:hypothetical protein
MAKWSDFALEAKQNQFPPPNTPFTSGHANAFPTDRLSTCWDRASRGTTELPGKAHRGQMHFSVSWSADTTSWTQILNGSTPISWRGAADKCSEDGMWDNIESSLGVRGYLAIAQTKPPCLRCHGCYRSMASSQGRYVLVWAVGSGETIKEGNSVHIYTPSGKARRIDQNSDQFM